MKRRTLYIIIAGIIVVVCGGLFWYLTTQSIKVTFINSDTIIDGDYTIEKKQKIVIRNDSILTIKGNLATQGEVSCENGGLKIVVEGDAEIASKLACDRSETGETGISLVVEGSLDLNQDGNLVSNSPIQIVDSQDHLAKTKEEIDELYQEVGQDTGEGLRIGPLVPEGEMQSRVFPPWIEKRIIASPKATQDRAPLFSLIPKAQAQGPGPIVNIGGKIEVEIPPPGVKVLVLFHFPKASVFRIQNFELIGPDGRAGESDAEESCDAKGADGGDAFRFFARAPNITVNNFILRLGYGGRGGDAETKEDCDPGKAAGGNGGKPGNFKMLASQKFEIKGAFVVHPGEGGDGGDALAFGRNGSAGEDGGDAEALGGDGADNKKRLRIMGTIAGTDNIQIDSMLGGNGGMARAVPGNGGNGEECKNGGRGGSGKAQGGRGGDVSIVLAGNVGRTGTAMDLGGDGSNVKTNGGNGGNGGDCDSLMVGGHGGHGGDAEATPGKGGIGASAKGRDGIIEAVKGGNGGNGGDGCYEGLGGGGGNGNPSGQDGSKGEKVCKLPEEPKVTPETEPGPEGQGLSFTCSATSETVEGSAMNYLTVKVAGNTYRFPEFTCADSQNYKVAWCDKVESIPADRVYAEDYVINLFYEDPMPCEPLAGYEASCDQMKGASGIIYGNCSYLSTAP